MPPLPGAEKTRPAKGRRQPSTPNQETREPVEEKRPSSAGSRSGRVTKADVLRAQIQRSYMVLGAMVKPFGRFYPVITPISENMQELSSDAADAWMDLAQKDKRVLDWLEKMMEASVYGNLVGIHLAIFAAALPAGGYLEKLSGPDDFAEIREQGRNMGLSEDEINEAIRMAQNSDIPARDMASGGPGDTFRTGGEPVAPVSPQGHPQTASSKSSIVTPDELGVTQAGVDGTFPHDTAPPNGSGQVVNG